MAGKPFRGASDEKETLRGFGEKQWTHLWRHSLRMHGH